MSDPATPSTRAEPTLARGVAQAPLPRERASPGTPLYVHLPFCAAKCHYCDFFSVPAEGHDRGAMIAAILREAELLAAKKPLVISMSDMAASGGYWISLSASRILALPETITASIGVISGKLVLKGLYDKIGVTKEILRTSPYAAMYSDYEPFSEAERQKVVADMRRIYDEFLAKVARNRKMDKAAVDRIAQGRVWSGSAALRLKLVDAMGGLSAAVDEARKLARIPAGERYGIRVYPQKKSFFEMIFDMAGARARNPLDVREQLRAYQNYFPALALPFALRCF